MSLEQLVEVFDRAPPRYVLQQLSVRSREDLLMLSVYSTIGGAVFLRACEANPAITFVVGGMRANCGQIATQFANTMQFIGVQGTQQNIAQNRNELLIALRCGRGQADRAACAAYAGTLRNVHQMQHNTSMAIIQNLPTGTCVVGRDPNCVP
ncbi:MAG: hypothetical protein AAFV29_13825 [Myxococcota bacterium]